jgi:guanine deaminase
VRGEIDYLADALVAIDSDGIILPVIRNNDPDYVSALGVAENEENFVTLPPEMRVLPGFVALHIHAPQYASSGRPSTCR